jgi:hypothetical protein
VTGGGGWEKEGKIKGMERTNKEEERIGKRMRKKVKKREGKEENI